MRKTNKDVWFLLAGLSVLAAGCAHDYRDPGYGGAPEGAVDARESGPPVLKYEVPAEQPKGKAYVLSLGPEDVPGPDKKPQPMLHLRIALENESDVDWTLDPAEMTVAFDGTAPVTATYARSTPRGAKLSVPAGKRGELDLFFPLPDPQRPTRADLAWLLHRGGEPVAMSSRFDVLRGPADADVYYRPVDEPGVVYIYGPGWWWGPSWYWGWWGSPWWWGGWYGPRYYGGWGYGGWHHRGPYNYPGYRPYRGGLRGGYPSGGLRPGTGSGGLRPGIGSGGFRGGGMRGAPMGRGPRR